MTGTLKNSVRYLVLLTFLAVTVFPVIWLSYTSSKTSEEVTRSRWALPGALRVENFRKVFEIRANAGVLDAAHAAVTSKFTRYFLNSLWISAAAVVIATAASALAAFAFARLRFFGTPSCSSSSCWG